MLPAISPQEAFERFSKGEARLVDIRETDEYTQEFVPGSRLIPLSIIAKHPLKDADAPDKPIVFFCHSGNRTANASDLLERLAGDVQAYRLDGGISGWEKRGLPWSISPQPSLCSVRFRSRPVPWCSSASSAVPSGIRSSGCPPLSARGWSSPGFPGSAASACCFRTCRGTGVEPVIRKIKNSGAPRQRYPVRRLACGGEPFQRDRIFQPTRLLTGASFHREKLSTRHTNGWGAGQKGAAQARSPSGSPPHAAVPRDLAQTHQAVHTLFGVRAAWSFYRLSIWLSPCGGEAVTYPRPA